MVVVISPIVVSSLFSVPLGCEVAILISRGAEWLIVVIYALDQS